MNNQPNMKDSFFFRNDVHTVIRQTLGYSQAANDWWIKFGTVGTINSDDVKLFFKDWWCEDRAVAERLYKELECHAPQYIQIERASDHGI